MGLTQKQIDAMAKSNQEANYLTREAIKESLYLLMKDKPFHEIRITEIIHRAGVSRSAFYHNYKTKEEVLFESVQDTQELIRNCIGDVVENNWKVIFTNIKTHERNLRLLLDAGLENHLLKCINEYSYFKTTNYYTALWNGLIFNAILFYAQSGFGDPEQAAASVHTAMLAMTDLLNSQYRQNTETSE